MCPLHLRWAAPRDSRREHREMRLWLVVAVLGAIRLDAPLLREALKANLDGGSLRPYLLSVHGGAVAARGVAAAPPA